MRILLYTFVQSFKVNMKLKITLNSDFGNCLKVKCVRNDFTDI